MDAREAIDDAARLTVLVVDDEESVHRLVATRLPWCELIHAYSGWQAREALTAHIDLVLLDVNLPDTTGLCVLAEIRELDDRPVVAMLSSDASPRTISQAMALGAVGYLPKTAETYQALADHVRNAVLGQTPMIH